MTKKPWGGAGAWAADSELADSQNEQEQQPQESSFANDAAFPSLGEAIHVKVSKKKKQAVPLSKFISRGTASFSESKGLTTQEMMMLPAGPRDRSGEDSPPGGLGGAFKDYGAYRGEGRDRDGGMHGSRRSDREGGYSRGGFTGDMGGTDEPSRADSNDDWAATKKYLPSSRGRYEDNGRRGGDGSRFNDRDFPSKADVDNHWGSSKKFVPAPPSNGSERRTLKYDFSSSRNGGLDGVSKADDTDNWGTSKKSSFNGGYNSSLNRDKDFGLQNERDGAYSKMWTGKDASRASGRPHLVLQPRSRPLDSSSPPHMKEETENQPPFGNTSSEASLKPHKVNPFGEAKPREVILEEKGLNWKKLDAEIEQKSLDRTETEQLSLKEEIKAIQDALKFGEAKLERTGSEAPIGVDASGTLADLKDKLAKKQHELEQLTVAFGDSIGALRIGSERPPSSLGNRDSGMVHERGKGRW